MRPGELHGLRVTRRAYAAVSLNSSALGTICNQSLRQVETQIFVIQIFIILHVFQWLVHFGAFWNGAYIVLILQSLARLRRIVLLHPYPEMLI